MTWPRPSGSDPTLRHEPHAVSAEVYRPRFIAGAWPPDSPELTTGGSISPDLREALLAVVPLTVCRAHRYDRCDGSPGDTTGVKRNGGPGHVAGRDASDIAGPAEGQGRNATTRVAGSTVNRSGRGHAGIRST